MRKFLIASLLIAGVATPALAAQQHFVVQDSSGYCAVIDAHPSKVCEAEDSLATPAAMTATAPPSRRLKPSIIAPARPSSELTQADFASP